SQSRYRRPARTSAARNPAGCAVVEYRSRWAPSPTADTTAAPPAPPESCSTADATGLPPRAHPPDPHQALHPDLPHAGRHTARLHRLAPREGILALNPGIARNALLAHPRRAPVHRLLKRTLFHTLLVPPAPVLIDQHDPVLRP